MFRKYLYALSSVIFLALIPKVVGAEEKLEVVTTFYPVYAFTKEILGDEGEAQLLIKAGTEVHDFQPSTKDMAKIKQASVFVYADEELETWVPNVMKALGKNKPTTIKANEGLTLLSSHEEHEKGEEEHNHSHDPHVWTSPKRAINMVGSIRDQLIKAFPDKKEKWRKNAQNYLIKLKKLDKDYRTTFAKAKQKSFVTQHTAFSYLAKDYGLTQVSMAGLSADKEPSAKRLASLSQYVKKNGISYIYFEENASKKVAQTLSQTAGVKIAVLNPLESLTQQQMKQGEDYISIMRQNLKNLKLTTDAPPKK